MEEFGFAFAAAHQAAVVLQPGQAVGSGPGAVREILLNPKYTGYMVWNRRATKDRRHPGRTNPREEWIISSRPEHPALVPVELFLAAQQPPRSGERARVDAPPMAPNPHRQTKSVYRLRSHVHCAACQRRMHGKRNRHGTAYSYCQPRSRQIPDGHPPTIWVREDTLLQAITAFFNTHVLGPDRITLARASLPAAVDHAAQEHHHRGDVIRRRLRELDDSMNNLMRVLEKTRDPDGQIYRRTQRRMAELEHQLAEGTRQLSDHEAAPPPQPNQDVGLLHHLPIIEIDLNTLAADRLRRFLAAFQVAIHYDHRTRRATLRAEISGEVIHQLARIAARAANPRSGHHHRQPTDAQHETGPADNGGAEQTIMHSSRMCPRRVPYNMGTPRDQRRNDVRGARRYLAVAGTGT